MAFVNRHRDLRALASATVRRVRRRYDSGRPIAGASVELDGPSRGRAISSADGTFAIRSIAAGTYLVRVVARGFARRSETTVEVTAGETASVPLFLVPTDAESDSASIASTGRAAFPPATNGQSPIQALRGVTPSTLVAPAAGTAADARTIELARDGADGEVSVGRVQFH
jgi:hypothetical protein